MYTSHFYDRMSERVFYNEKKITHKEQKIQNKHSKTLAKKALNNPIAEYKDTYGYKYIYAYIGQICYKYIFKGQKVITMYEIDLEKESRKYELKFNY